MTKTDCNIIQGNALDVLRTLESESVQCCVTSPPYLGLRDYGTEPQIWDGDEFCDHVWIERITPAASGLVAIKHRRAYIGIELLPENVEMTERRLAETQVKLF